MKKYFSSGFFLKFKSKLSAFQRTQPELLGVSEQETAHETKQYPPPLGPGLKSPSSFNEFQNVLKTRVPMYITKTKFSYQNRFSVYLCNVKWFLIASKQLRNVPKHLPSHKISFSNLFLSFSNDFLYEIHLKFPKLPILNRKS